MNEIEKLKPTCIWRNFYALTQIPRPSGHVEKIQQYLLDFAKKVGVEAFQDPAGNIVMRKPATPGMENRKCITMQAHMDMVPQKTPESKHNFEKDRPIPSNPTSTASGSRPAAPRWALTTVWAWQPSWQSWKTTPSSMVPSRASSPRTRRRACMAPTTFPRVR